MSSNEEDIKSSGRAIKRNSSVYGIIYAGAWRKCRYKWNYQLNQWVRVKTW